MYEKIRVTVGGDAEGGWLIDIHDGENSVVYNPEAPHADGAVEAALADHRKDFPAAPPESDYTPTDDKTDQADVAASTETASEGAAPAPDAATDPAQTVAG